MLWKIPDIRQIKDTENTQIKYNSENANKCKIQKNKTTLV